jgi:prepilin-type N-terminal cleavage/methylation domain-containing protein
MAHARSQRGFTLIEIMISVAIVGLLASIAVPAFQKYTLRAKVVERRSVMMNIKRAVQDYYVRTGVTVPGGGKLDSGWNPPLPPITSKRQMLTNMAAWNTYFSAAGGGSSVPLEIEGSVYYSYRFLLDETPAGATITVLAAGDLDGDGIISYKQLVYTRGGGMYQLTNEYPPADEEDEASAYATF